MTPVYSTFVWKSVDSDDVDVDLYNEVVEEGRFTSLATVLSNFLANDCNPIIDGLDKIIQKCEASGDRKFKKPRV